jgi:hypothetical protein
MINLATQTSPPDPFSWLLEMLTVEQSCVSVSHTKEWSLNYFIKK